MKKVAECSLTGFFDSLVYQPKPFNHIAYFAKAGLVLTDTNLADKNTKASIGLSTTNNNGRLMVSYVEARGGANQSGLNVNDELIAVNGFRLNNET